MANEVQSWRGAIEPAESSPSGNEIQLWRGAVEPAEPAVAAGNVVLKIMLVHDHFSGGATV